MRLFTDREYIFTTTAEKAIVRDVKKSRGFQFLLSMNQDNQLAVKIQVVEGERPMTKKIKFDSKGIANVHADALWEATNMEARLAQKFTNVSDVKVLTKMVSVPQHDDRSTSCAR